MLLLHCLACGPVLPRFHLELTRSYALPAVTCHGSLMTDSRQRRTRECALSRIDAWMEHHPMTDRGQRMNYVSHMYKVDDASMHQDGMTVRLRASAFLRIALLRIWKSWKERRTVGAVCPVRSHQHRSGPLALACLMMASASLRTAGAAFLVVPSASLRRTAPHVPVVLRRCHDGTVTIHPERRGVRDGTPRLPRCLIVPYE
jgi:hypothetical protein